MSAAYIPSPATEPAALPDPTIPGTTVRYHVGDDLAPDLRAVLKHEPVDALAVLFRDHGPADIAAALDACGTHDAAVLLGHLASKELSA